MRELNILSDHVVVIIFGNIEQLMSVNTELLIHLKSLSIGEAFCRLGPFLKLYSTYANNHERALAALMVIYAMLESPELGIISLCKLWIIGSSKW